MKTRFLVLPLALLFASGAAFANDQIVSTVTNGSGPQAVIVNNGVPSGTIQLWYAYAGGAFPCGSFATFNLAMLDQAGNGKQMPTYPVTLNLVQSGDGTPVQLSASPSNFTGETAVTGEGWSTGSTVTVSIDCSKLTGAPYDGEDIVGNLNENTTPSGSHLDTISTIQVHIVLAMPTACLKLYSFETYQDSGTALGSVQVVANKKTGVINSTNPGTISADGLVVNTCQSSQNFDLGVSLDPQWSTIPANNPGNATFTYDITGAVDPSTLNMSALTGTPMGEGTCLQNVTLPAGDSYLVTVHSAIDSGLYAASLPASGKFSFAAEVYNPTTSGMGCTGGALSTTLVAPANPASSTLPFTIH